MKIIITGGSGRLGKDLHRTFGVKHEVLAPSHTEFDITNPSQVIGYVDFHQPDILIHSAAMADADVCQLNPAQAYLVNTLATQNLAIACRKRQTTMVFISTDYVFDGLKGNPYTEFDATNPINIYGQSKLAAEQILKETLERYFIIRTAWLFGIYGNNFLTGVIHAADMGTQIRAAFDQKGSPTSTLDLSMALLHLVDTPFYGVYNVVNRGGLTWYEYARLILSISGKQAHVEPIRKEERGPSPRPANTTLEPMCLDLRGIFRMPDITEAIEVCISELKQK